MRDTFQLFRANPDTQNVEVTVSDAEDVGRLVAANAVAKAIKNTEGDNTLGVQVETETMAKAVVAIAVEKAMKAVTEAAKAVIETVEDTKQVCEEVEAILSADTMATSFREGVLPPSLEGKVLESARLCPPSRLIAQTVPLWVSSFTMYKASRLSRLYFWFYNDP